MAAIEQSRVEEILVNYDSKEVTDQLYEMGKLLLDDCMQRVDQLDRKAVAIAGYTGAIIALMVSTFSIWTAGVDKWAIIFVAVGCLIGLVGGCMALASTWPQQFDMPSDSDWFEEAGLTNPDKLKRYHISSMHLSITSHEKVNARKVVKIKRSQICLSIMILLLLTVLSDATYRAITRPPSQLSLDHAGAKVSFYLRHQSSFLEEAPVSVSSVAHWP